MNNELQKAMWNGRAGASWVRHNSLLETLLGEPGHACMDSLRLIPGMRILDVGCGCGNQTLDLAARLDTSSLVTGIDISEPMLALAGDLKDANNDSPVPTWSFYWAMPVNRCSLMDNLMRFTPGLVSCFSLTRRGLLRHSEPL